MRPSFVSPSRSSSARCVVAIAAALLLSGTAMAQTRGLPQQTLSSPPESEILEDVFASTLSGKTQSRALNAYLSPASLSPEEVVRRASALIRAIGKRRSTLPAGQVLGAVERVARVAERAISTTSVRLLAVDDNYAARNATIALDFGPRDGSVMTGFERVVAGDPRVSGDGVNALRRPSENALLSDGLSGVKKIELDVPNGRYRVVLMTQNLNDAGLNRSPFGQAVLVNQVPFRIADSTFKAGGNQTLLTNAEIAAPANRTESTEGIPAGDTGALASSLFRRQQGGAIILEGTTTDGKLRIELRGFGNAKSYITGLLVEPMVRGVNPRLAFESRILAAAAEAVAGIDPVAGNPLERPESQTSNTL
jgi:hypothetical protein